METMAAVWLITLIQGVSATAKIAGSTLLSGATKNSRKWGFIILLVSQAFTVAAFIHAELWIFLSQQPVYLVLNIRGIINNK